MSFDKDLKDFFFLIKMRKKEIEKLENHNLTDSERIMIKRFGKQYYIIDEIRISSWVGITERFKRIFVWEEYYEDASINSATLKVDKTRDNSKTKRGVTTKR